MAAVAMSPDLNAEQRLFLHNVTWQTYESLLTLFGDRPLRLTYDRGNLEIMAPSKKHERLGHILGRLIVTLTEELGMGVQGAGSTTFRKEALVRGLEPDECFYLRNEPLIRGRDQYDPHIDPPPDLAVEIDLSRGPIDRMAIYASLGVPEVWRFDGTTLQVHLLGSKRTYSVAERSRNFAGLRPQELVRFLKMRSKMDDNQVVRAFRRWVHDTFLADGGHA